MSLNVSPHNMLNQIVIQNFRIVTRAELALASPRSFLVGDNGQGKTSVLEAINLLAKDRLARGSELKHLVQHGAPFAKVSGSTANGDIERRMVRSASGRLQKEFLEQGVSKPFSKRRIPFYTVFFSPADVRIFTGPPSRRREFIDNLLASLSHVYKNHLSRYEKTLQNRNKVLELGALNGHINEQLLQVLTTTLVESAAIIWSERLQFLTLFIPLYDQLSAELWHDHDPPNLHYHPALNFHDKQPSAVAIAELYGEQLQFLHQRERALGRTCLGPHLDDLYPLRGGNVVADYASRGETRTLAIALKLAELQSLEIVTQTKPILLLDDVMSEMDKPNRERIEAATLPYQTIFTATETSFFSPSLLRQGTLYRVHEGKFTHDQK